MRLLTIGLLSVFLFFPIYIGLHPLIGEVWASWIAAAFMYVVLPVLFLYVFPKEWRHPLAKAGNYLIALTVLGVSVYLVKEAFSKGEEEINAVLFFWFYGAAALYYLAFGHMHWSAPEDEEPKYRQQ